MTKSKAEQPLVVMAEKMQEAEKANLNGEVVIRLKYREGAVVGIQDTITGNQKPKEE